MTPTTYGRRFWRDASERALKTAAQAAVLAGAALATNVLDLNTWTALFSAAAGGAVLSLFTSIASAPVGEPDSASVSDLRRP
jgi:hypothetical protein